MGGSVYREKTSGSVECVTGVVPSVGGLHTKARGMVTTQKGRAVTRSAGSVSGEHFGRPPASRCNVTTTNSKNKGVVRMKQKKNMRIGVSADCFSFRSCAHSVSATSLFLSLFLFFRFFPLTYCSLFRSFFSSFSGCVHFFLAFVFAVFLLIHI